MWSSVSVSEVGMITVAFAAAAILACLRQRSWRWAAVGLTCITVATLVTPADPLSTIVISVALLLFFVGGTRFNRATAVSAV